MRALIPMTILCATLLIIQVAQSQAPKAAAKPETMESVAAETYEHLATAIIAIEATEDDLVKSILLGHHAVAQRHLKMAIEDAANRKAHLEAAAAEIGNIANEGDKRIQAVRQRLAKAGHTHNTDVETKEDYMFITNREKKDLLALARSISQADKSSAADIQKLASDLADRFGKAIAPQ